LACGAFPGFPDAVLFTSVFIERARRRKPVLCPGRTHYARKLQVIGQPANGCRAKGTWRQRRQIATGRRQATIGLL